jgi:hypothetical protein
MQVRAADGTGTRSFGSSKQVWTMLMQARGVAINVGPGLNRSSAKQTLFE